jgi:hypothetical protein
VDVAELLTNLPSFNNLPLSFCMLHHLPQNLPLRQLARCEIRPFSDCAASRRRDVNLLATTTTTTTARDIK